MEAVERYEIAIHEAAHAVMAILKFRLVYEIAIVDNPDEDDLVGECVIESGNNVFDEIAINLAGAIATALHKGLDRSCYLDLVSLGDYLTCHDLLAGLARPKVPCELVSLLGTDDPSNAAFKIREGRHLYGVTGPTRRKLKRSCQRFLKDIRWASRRATEVLAQEEKEVWDYIENHSSFMILTYALADELYAKGKLDACEILECIKPIVEERCAAAQKKSEAKSLAA